MPDLRVELDVALRQDIARRVQAGERLKNSDFAGSLLIRAILREDEMIKPAPGFWPSFGPLEPAAGPGSLGRGSGSKNSAGCTHKQPRRPILSPIRGHFMFLGPTAKR